MSWIIILFTLKLLLFYVKTMIVFKRISTFFIVKIHPATTAVEEITAGGNL
jgi:hypothetical protein